MKYTPSNPGPAQCEEILKAERAYNVEHEILVSENAVIDRLLGRSLELQGAYTELATKLHNNPRTVSCFLRTLLSAAAFWCPEKNAEARQERKKLAEVNTEISAVASQLADLLKARSDLHNHSGFSSGDIYDLHSAVEAAASDHTMFQWYVKSEFQRLFAQYDLKYWPSLPDVIRAIGEDAGSTEVHATDPLTEAGTKGARASQADFFRSWLASIEENSAAYSGFLPKGFRLSDESMASLAGCALGLDPDHPVGAEYVKRLRQRAREARASDEDHEE